MGTRTTLMCGAITGLVVGILLVVGGSVMVVLKPYDDVHIIQGKIIIELSYFYVLEFNWLD